MFSASYVDTRELVHRGTKPVFLLPLCLKPGMAVHFVSSNHLTLVELSSILSGNVEIQLSEDAIQKIPRYRKYLDEKLGRANQPVYGINTVFGSFYNRSISNDESEKLQENPVNSHACSTRPEVPDDIVRLMFFLKIQSLSYGYSGIQLSTVERLIDMSNKRVWPRIFEMGSLGASGDLAPPAHLSVHLLGPDEDRHGNNIPSTETVQHLFGWPPVHNIHPHAGQIRISTRVREMLLGSEMLGQPKKHAKAPYSLYLYCMRQVHGANADAAEYVTNVFPAEINSVTDNPNVFTETDTIISAGNFCGQPLALALAELGGISERRTYQLISGERDLPNYLVASPGINSGLMIPQYTAASLVSQNKQLCTPASVDSIVSSNGQEDDVSMGANAATKAYRIVENLYLILAIELMITAQALVLRRPLRTSPFIETFVDTFRQSVPFIEDDRVLHLDIKKAEEFLKSRDSLS